MIQNLAEDWLVQHPVQVALHLSWLRVYHCVVFPRRYWADSSILLSRHHIQIFLTIIIVPWEVTVPSSLFKYATTVWLSSKSKTRLSFWPFRKAFIANDAAKSSRQLMWYAFSSADHGPPMRTPWQGTPQPSRDASNSMERLWVP